MFISGKVPDAKVAAANYKHKRVVREDVDGGWLARPLWVALRAAQRTYVHK